MLFLHNIIVHKTFYSISSNPLLKGTVCFVEPAPRCIWRTKILRLLQNANRNAAKEKNVPSTSTIWKKNNVTSMNQQSTFAPLWLASQIMSLKTASHPKYKKWWVMLHLLWKQCWYRWRVIKKIRLEWSDVKIGNTY